MKALLMVTAVIEGLVGLALFVMPELTVWLLLNTPLDSVGGVLITRVGGVAITSLAFLCWRARGFQDSRAAGGIVTAMLFYNIAVAAVLILGGSRLDLKSVFIWPVIFLHIALAIWCAANVRLQIRKLFSSIGSKIL